MRISLSFFVLLINIQWLSAQNHDFIWLFGYDSNATYLEWGGTVIDFNNIPLDISYLYNEMNFVQVNASICNEEGELQFYTNGLYVANQNHQPMLNGAGLNPGPFANDMGDIGYILDQGAFVVPHPDSTSRYYLIHADRVNSTIELKAHTSRLYYTLVDMNQANGLGKVMQKNQVIISDTLGLGKLTTVRHANGRDWWILQPELNTNMYYRVLISTNGIENLGKAEIQGFQFKSGVGQAVFSPDGNIFARMNSISLTQGQYVEIYQFDRCTGLLSNQIQIHYDDDAYAAGIAISPNSRYLYVSSFTNLYQFDLQSSNIQASKKKVAEFDGFNENGIYTTFYLAQLAPDGKIYINVPSGVHYLHVIHQPNLPYPDCNVEQHGIHLPTYNSASLPNFPNYRLGPLDGSPCDTLGLDNHPIAKYRYDQDTNDYLSIRFTDLSYYEPSEWGWDFGDGIFSDEVNPVHTYPQDGIYEVCLSVANNYGINTYCRTLQIGTTATDDTNPQITINVFPNPASEATNILIGGDYLPRHAVLSLFNGTGQVVRTQHLPAGWSVVPLDALAPGFYFYEVKDEGRILGTGKLVKVE
jgi:PKD repeat protein